MNEPLIIKYETNTEGFDLGNLGESFVGLNALLREFSDLTGINGDVEVRTTRIDHGSVELYNVFHLTLTSAPFATPKELFDFLRLASPEMLRTAQQYFSTAQGAHHDVNTYFAEHPVDQAVLQTLLAAFVIRAWKWAGKLKLRPVAQDAELGEITPRQAGKLRSLVQGGRYKRVVKPIVEGNVTKISIVASNAPDIVPATISEENVGDYLPEDAKILPELENGTIHEFTGQVVALQSTKGDMMKIRVHGIDPSNSLLTAYPDNGQDSEDFKEFYKKDVAFTAEIVRRNMYKRPEIVIKGMTQLQGTLI